MATQQQVHSTSRQCLYEHGPIKQLQQWVSILPCRRKMDDPDQSQEPRAIAFYHFPRELDCFFNNVAINATSTEVAPKRRSDALAVFGAS